MTHHGAADLRGRCILFYLEGDHHMNCKREDLLVYAITDRSWLNGESLYSQVEKSLKGGATFMQLREKNLDDETFYQEAV